MDLFKANQGKGEGGFTLIELLVVIAILAVLAAVAIPAYSRFFGAGTDEANSAELSNIQASMDAMMAHHRLLNVAVPAASTAFFHALPIGIDPLDGSNYNITTDQGILPDGKYEFLHPSFLRIGSDTTSPTKKCYTWDITGFITQVEGIEPDVDGLCP